MYKNWLQSYGIAIALFLGVLLVATTLAWGELPKTPQAPLLNISPGMCPEGFVITRTVYDTQPGGDGYFAVYGVNDVNFLVIAKDDTGVIRAWVELPGRETTQLTYEQLTERYANPCEIAALVVGAPQ